MTGLNGLPLIEPSPSASLMSSHELSVRSGQDYDQPIVLRGEDVDMNIFITGSTGFVGSHLVKRLSNAEHKLTCLVRETSNLRMIEAENISLVVGDVRDEDSIRNGMRNCEWVVNLASVYSFWEPSPEIYYEVNVKGTRNVMECALQTGVSKVVHISTYGAFGIQEACPFTEQNPPSSTQSCAYSDSKYQSDQHVWELYRSRDLPVTVLYPANILGAGDDKATSQYIQNIMFQRFPVRVLEDHFFTCVHVKDVVDAIYNALHKDGCIGEKYLIGKHYLTFKEFNGIISDVSGADLPRFALPDTIAVWMAGILTFIADLLQTPPLYGLSRDLVSAMMSNTRCNGKKAERELGISYTPIKAAIEEAVMAYMD
jgi:dihydroflavonol-4-reductase